MEIERKYLFEELPADKEELMVLHLTQGYVSRDPVIRVRRTIKSEACQDGGVSTTEERYILTVKGSGKSVREEMELRLTKEQYEGLMPKVSGRIIDKFRYLVPLGPECDGTGKGTKLVAEADVFQGDLSWLKMVEVEFPDIETMNAFVKPDWFGKDVTEDVRYQNSNLSRE